MRTQLLASTVAVGLAAVAAPASAAAAPVQVDSLTLNPSCVHPGGSLTANVSVQNTTYSPQTFYAQEFVSEFGVTIQSGAVQGSYTIPPLYTASQSQSTSIPSYTPYGYYTVNVGVGPSSSSPTSWSSVGTGLTVSPFC